MFLSTQIPKNILSAFIIIALTHVGQFVYASSDSKSYTFKITTTILIENDGNTPIVHHLIDCDEKNGDSRLSHIVAKLDHVPMPVTKTEDGKMWRIDLSSKPVEPGVTTSLVVTKVFSHLELVPCHDIYLMPYSTIQYQVRVIKQGRSQKIKVPSEQYYLLVENKDLADLDESASTALALETEGSTKVRFIDKSVISDEDFIQPESTIHIVNPSYLTMRVTPGDSWALQKFTDYVIEIRIYDADQHLIYPSDNIDIQLTTGSELVVTNSTSNGTYHIIHTLNSGPSKISARLLGTTPTLYSYGKPYQDIEIVQELHIYEPLEVQPTAIILPWLSHVKPSYQVSIFAAGGTNSYRWHTNNSDLTNISYSDEDSSVARIITSGEGVASVQCSDVKSPVFTRTSVVVVSKIVELNVLPSITETELGGDIMLPIAVYANITPSLEPYIPQEERENNLVLFHDCSKIKFDVDIVEKARFTHDPDQMHPNIRPKSCMSLKFTCTQPGSSRVWISYSDSSDPLAKPIKTTAVIACYKPLRPVYPNDIGVMAVQTSIEMAFEGGPRSFGSRIDDHYAYLEPSNDPIVSFTPIIDRYRYNKDLHVFRAHCNDYGEVSVTLNVGNQPSPILPNPASSKASVKILCAKPDSIQLRPRLKTSCPLNEMTSLTDTLVPISSTTPTEFDLTVYDDSKRPFLNISSFSIKSTLNGHGMINSKQVEDVNAVAGFRRVIRNFITVQPNGVEGLGKIETYLSHYKNQGLYRGYTLDLNAYLDIQFVDSARINPNRTIIYNHHKNIVILTIAKGSGYFSVDSLQGANYANVTYASVYGQHRIHVMPLSAGKLSIRVEDQCIDSIHGAPVLSDVSIIGDQEFSREALKPGRLMKYCKDIDDSMFCIYLVETDLPRALRNPISSSVVTKPPQTSTPAPTQEPTKMQVITEAPTTTVSPAPVASGSTNPLASDEEVTQKASVLQVLMGYLITLLVTASAITIAYKWWHRLLSKCDSHRVSLGST